MLRILVICVLFGCSASRLPAQQAAPLRTELLMRLTADLAPPQEIGVTPLGNRRIYYVTRGTFTGPRLKGEVLPGGGDWVLTDKDGVSHLDVRITLRCDDGSLIFVSYRGIVDIAPDIRARIAKGEDVSPDLYYFRISPVFETGSAKLAWLNRMIAIGVGKKTATGIVYDIFTVTSTAADVGLNPSQFRGVNWARLSDPGSPSDNFHNDPLILQGLSSPDFSGAHYASIRAQADAILAAFQSSLGANMIRIPVNPETVLSPWWNSYRGIIDAATARGMNVDLSYWAENEAGKENVVSNTALWNQMWTTIIGDYKANRRVYFNPFQEPIGYRGTSWLNVAAEWLQVHNNVTRNRVFMPGIGYQADITPLCKDPRFDGTYLALHVYAFPSSPKSYDQWVKEIKSGIGSCASRTVVEEFGGPMDTGVNYDDPNPGNSQKIPGIDYKNGNYSTVVNLPYMRAITDVIHDDNLGAIEWDALGGRNYDGGHEPFSLLRLNPNSPNGLPLWIPNATGVDRLRYAWHTGNRSAGAPGPGDLSKPR